jgi:hypothetical protein
MGADCGFVPIAENRTGQESSSRKIVLRSKLKITQIAPIPYPNFLCRFLAASNQLHFSCVVFQGVVLRTGYAQPEMFDPVLGCGKSKEPSSIETHQQLGAVRIGTL